MVFVLKIDIFKEVEVASGERRNFLGLFRTRARGLEMEEKRMVSRGREII